LYLCGSIGYDAALAPDGVVWVNDYFETDEENWRVATEKERLGFLLHAQHRTFPELILLVRALNAREDMGNAGHA